MSGAAGVDLPDELRDIDSLIARDDLAEAEAALGRILARQPSAVGLHVLHARLLRELGRIEEAGIVQKRLVAVFPGNFSLRFDLAETLLLLGDFAAGWREYRHRYSLPHTVRIERKVQRPRWSGQPLHGGTILIHDEQGYGDTFQFLRLVGRVRERGGRVILQVHPDILPLARRLAGHDVLIARGDLPPPFDFHCELMSLPLALGLRLEDLPGSIPYLSAYPPRIQRWRRRFDGLMRPLIALAWAGSPTHLRDAARSLSLAQFAPLASLGGTFVSVQKGPRAAEAAAPPAGMRLLDLDREINDFEDTAAVLSLADLLISVDSSPIHLAGALGRPVWALIPFLPDWRWLLGRDDSPWYPTMRLFRQPQRGDWAAAISRVAATARDGWNSNGSNRRFADAGTALNRRAKNC